MAQTIASSGYCLPQYVHFFMRVRSRLSTEN
jgi:hypothetical protein